MKRVLIVSPHFPPINAPDMQRIRMSLPYYRAHGWDPVVLTVAPQDVPGVLEPELGATVPADARIVTCRAWPARWARRFGVGNLGHRAWYGLWRKGAELLRRERFDLVFFSNTQFTTFALGPLWRRRFGVPYVLDVQDPWRTDYYGRKGSRKPPGGWKYQFARLQALGLEGPCFRRASGIISVSGSYLDELRARYRDLAAPAAVIPFGASAVDVAVARRLTTAPFYIRRPGDVHVVYTGASGPIMPHAARVLFDALRQFAERSPQLAARLRFHFYGTSYVGPGEGRRTVMPLAEECGVAGFVDEIPHRLGHLECLRLQAEADLLLLPGSSDLAYSPSKIYPYYLSGAPVLGLVFRGSVLERVLDQLHCAHLVRFDEHGDKSEAHHAIARFLGAALEGRLAELLPERDEGAFNDAFGAEPLTRRQCALFAQAVAGHAAESAGRP